MTLCASCVIWRRWSSSGARWAGAAQMREGSNNRSSSWPHRAESVIIHPPHNTTACQSACWVTFPAYRRSHPFLRFPSSRVSRPFSRVFTTYTWESNMFSVICDINPRAALMHTSPVSANCRNITQGRYTNMDRLT